MNLSYARLHTFLKLARRGDDYGYGKSCTNRALNALKTDTGRLSGLASGSGAAPTRVWRGLRALPLAGCCCGARCWWPWC